MKARLDFLILFILMLLTAIVFISEPIDIWVAQQVYFPNHAEQAFPIGEQAIWRFFYEIIPPVTTTLFLGSLAASLWFGIKGKKLLRGYALLVLFTLLIGPGLIVNSLFKENWQRPRPIQTSLFGGELAYVPPLIKGDSDGPAAKSFPSGHSSVAFATCAFWLIWRRRNPKLARHLLAVSLIFGAIEGATRIVAGGHYLSDVLFSAYFSFFAAFFSYYVLLRIPQLEDQYSNNDANINS